MNPFVYKAEWRKDDKGPMKKYLHHEVFGPHVALIPFDDLDDAIRIYNDTDYGLALGVVTDDFRKHRRIAQECDTGMLYVNGGSIGAESHLPFSSWKKSGGGASAAATWKSVTHSMAVTVNYEEGKMQFAQGMK
jgi:aldehyde dehydrogenase (NAD+)